MTYIPQVGNHGLMIEFKSEEAGCLEWEHKDPDTLTGHGKGLRETYRPDTDGTCLCTPYVPSVPPGFSTQDGPHTAFAEAEIESIMRMWGHNVTLEQRLTWYDEAAEEERDDHEQIWVD